MPVFVSFCSGPGYREEAECLARSLDALGLEHDIRELPDLGSWAKNVARKPAYIHEALDRHKPRAVCWLDADAIVRQPPVLLESLAEEPELFDVAVHFLEHPHRFHELLTGTVLVSNTASARELLAAWELALPAAFALRCPDQVALACAHTGEMKPFARLPAEYCWIFDTSARYYPGRLPIIEHFQASRRLRLR